MADSQSQSQVERMEAVKRAYAEIILNTAAESAARILASERKAVALQRSLASSKHDALHLMLRLKALMEAKIHEAETRNTLHARRILELESQLRHAQSLILSLQADLHRATNAPPPPTDNSSCSPSASSIPPHRPSKSNVRSRNRCTQRVTAFHQSKDPKGAQTLAQKAKTKNSTENGNGRDLFFRKDTPRRSRTKSNYVKISKFGLNIDGELAQNGNKVIADCSEKEKETTYNLDSGNGLRTDEALVGLELIADNIDKEDDKLALEKPALELSGPDPIPDFDEREIPVAEAIADRTTTCVTETEGLRTIKYTFRRKRKRASSEKNNGVPAVVPALEDNNVENKGNIICNEGENSNNEENSSEGGENRAQRQKLYENDEGVVSDSARSNRRLVQVARQLISLSTKKW